MGYEKLIKTFEEKVKQLTKIQNQNEDSGDMSSFALFDYMERQEQIDRLNLCIKLLKQKTKADLVEKVGE